MAKKTLLTLDDVRPLPSASRLDSVKERRKENPEKYDMELLGESCQAWLNGDDFRQQRARILRYIFGDQWGDFINYRGCMMTEAEYMRMKNNVPLKNNVMVSMWMSVVGIHAKQETEPVCYARSAESKRLSDMMSSALQTNWQNTYLPDMLDVVFGEYLISGAAFAREAYEERDQLHDSYTDYINPAYMFWKAGSDPVHRDVTLIGCLHDVTREELYYRFAKPRYGLTIQRLKELYHLNDGAQILRTSMAQNDINAYENLSFYQPSDSSMVRVIEVWKQEVKPRFQCHDPLASTQADAFFRIEKKDLPHVKQENNKRQKLYDEQQVPDEKRAYITTEEIVDKYWHFTYLTPEGFILAEGETPFDFKSHPFSMSLFPYVNGEIHPFMSFFLDQQRFINRLVAINDMAVRSSVKGVKFLPLSLKPDGMTIEDYANQITEFDSVIIYDDRKSRTGARPEFYTHSAFNIGANEMLQTQLNMIHEVSGVSGALQGKTPTSGTSAARYQMETQNATTTIYPLIKRFTSFKERLALKKVINIQQFYEDGRDITKQNADHQVFYDKPSARNVMFRVSIKDSLSAAAYAQLGNEFLDRLFEKGALPPDLYVKYYDAPMVDQLTVEFQKQREQMADGSIPYGPLQVPDANQAQAAMATQAMHDENTQIFTRQQPGAPLTAIPNQ